MQWQEVRESYPSQWVVLEAISAHDEADKRIFEDISVVKVLDDPMAAHHEYRHLHQKYPDREFLYVNTLKEKLDVTVHRWANSVKKHRFFTCEVTAWMQAGNTTGTL